LPVIGEREESQRIAAVSPRGNRLRFDERLALNQWMLSLFEVASFDDLAKGLDDPELEGFDDDNVSRLHHALAARLFGLHPVRHASSAAQMVGRRHE
jgi:hypothetical protein